MRRLLPILSLVSIVTVLAGAAQADEKVTVWLESGRTVTAQIDPRSSDTHLWLVRGDAGLSIARPIEWQRIVKAQRGADMLTREELKTIAKEVSAAVEKKPVEPLPLPKFHGVFAAPVAPDQSATDPAPPVRSLAIDAFHANWDSDVESDGLVVVVYPLDAFGQLTPVDGTLEVEVVAPEVRRFQDAPHGRGLTLERIANWTVAIHADDFTTGGARVQLPYQAVHPQFDWKTLPQGLVHARLTVPGQGTFDTTSDFVRLRPWSPLRDKLWRDTGRRFLPTERTGRGITQP
jgi:hypothetical protein